MVRIRLRRVGSAHQPQYRVIVADKEVLAMGVSLKSLVSTIPYRTRNDRF